MQHHFHSINQFRATTQQQVCALFLCLRTDRWKAILVHFLLIFHLFSNSCMAKATVLLTVLCRESMGYCASLHLPPYCHHIPYCTKHCQIDAVILVRSTATLCRDMCPLHALEFIKTTEVNFLFSWENSCEISIWSHFPSFIMSIIVDSCLNVLVALSFLACTVALVTCSGLTIRTLFFEKEKLFLYPTWNIYPFFTWQEEKSKQIAFLWIRLQDIIQLLHLVTAWAQFSTVLYVLHQAFVFGPFTGNLNHRSHIHQYL